MNREYELSFDFKEGILKEAVNKGVVYALACIEKKCHHENFQSHNLPYHNTVHTVNVIERTKEILSAIKKISHVSLSNHDLLIGVFSAAFHDIIQKWSTEEKVCGVNQMVIRRRISNLSEKESERKAFQFMSWVNKSYKSDVFTFKDACLIHEAIEATIPEWDVSLKTVVQPNLHKKSSVIALTVALSDINTAGYSGASSDIYKDEGNRIFRENNIDMLTLFLRQGKSFPMNFYRERILNWSSLQIDFAKGRKKMFPEEIAGLPDDILSTVAGFFTRFDQTIDEAEKRYEMRKHMCFEDLIRDVGY